MNIASFGLNHQKVIAFAVAVLAALGIWAYSVTPASIFPNMTFARVDVVAEAGDLPPDQIRTAVALPLERALLGLPSVTRVQTNSSQGSAEFIVTFDTHSDVRFDLQYVNQAIAQTRSLLPPDSQVRAIAIDPNQEPVISFALVSSTMSQTLLRELVQQTLVPQFYGIPGLARSLVIGGPAREYHVTLDPSALALHGLTAQDVGKAIADSTNVNAVGLQQQYYQRNVILLDANIKSDKAIEAIVVPDANKRPVTVGSLGTVTLGVEPANAQMSFDAKHGVAVNFFALPGADVVKMAAEIRSRMDALSGRLPAGVTVSRYWDQTDLIVESQKSLRDAILIGALLAILVILAFLRSWRMTLIAAIVIPIAMAIAVFAMNRLGQTLNLMSVGGLAVAVGLIIDDAIVVVENIARNLQGRPDLSKYDVVTLSMQELGPAMAASTFTTVVVFVPLLLLTGVSGFFFRALALTLSASLLVSLALALFVTPVLSAWFIRQGSHDAGEDSIIGRTLLRYEPLLRWALRRRRVVYAASACVLVVTVALLARLPSDFLPQLDEGQFEIRYQMPVGTTLAASDAAATQMERLTMQDPAVASVGRVTGIDTNGFSPTQARTGIIRVRLKPLGQRAGYPVVSARVRERLAAAVPAAQLDLHQILEDMINDLSGAPSPINVTLRGPDQQTLATLAQGVADKMSAVPGVADTFSGVSYDDPSVRIAPLGSRLAALGITSADLSGALSASAQGSVAAHVSQPSLLVPVRVSVLGAATDPLNALLATPSGLVSLGSLASVRHDHLSMDINEENGQRVMVVSANMGAGATLSGAIAGIKKVLAHVAFPPGYDARIGGAYAAQQQSFKEFVEVIAIAVMLVYAVMLATFQSFRLPLVILTAIPLALIGVALALVATGTPFNVSSFMGLLLLVGIVVKNGILLIDVANRERRAGATVDEALVTAGRTRLRPIVMTTFAAIGGLLPLALGLGAGSAMERPLAIAVIGGLSTATAFTLIVIPVLYAGIAGKRAIV